MATGTATGEPQAPDEREGGIAAAFADPPFRRLWLAEFLSQTALNAIWFAALVATERETRSTTQLSLTVVSALLPVALFGVLAGILVDRWDKKRVLVWSNVLRVGLAAGYLAYGRSIAVIFAMNFLINAVAQFFSPAMLATIPRLLPGRLLTAATGLFNVTLTLSQLLGMALLGPALVKLAGPVAVFGVASGLYVAATALVLLLPPDRGPRAAAGAADRPARGVLPALRDDLRAGWRFVRGDRPSALAMVYLATTWTVLFALITLAPRYAAAEEGLRLTAEDAIFLLAPAGLGMALAAALLDRLTGRFGRWRLVAWALLLLTVALALLAGVAPAANHLVRQAFDSHAARHAARYQILFGRTGVAMLLALLAG
jgi:MFS family permease